MATGHLPQRPIVRRVAAATGALAATVLMAVMAVVHTLLLDTLRVQVAAFGAAEDQGAVRRSHVGRVLLQQCGIPLNRFRR